MAGIPGSSTKPIEIAVAISAVILMIVIIAVISGTFYANS